MPTNQIDHDPATDTVPIEPLTDPGLLLFLQFQRKTLDWRDHAHAEITRTMGALHEAFSRYVDDKLETGGLRDHLFPDSACKSLRTEFIVRVKWSMRACLEQLDIALAKATKMPDLKESPTFRTDILSSKQFCLCLDRLQFKPSKRKEIALRIETWMVGPDGLAATFCNQATQMADRLIEKQRAC